MAQLLVADRRAGDDQLFDFRYAGQQCRSASVTGCSPKLMATTSLASLSFSVASRPRAQRCFWRRQQRQPGQRTGKRSGPRSRAGGEPVAASATCHGRISTGRNESRGRGRLLSASREVIRRGPKQDRLPGSVSQPWQPVVFNSLTLPGMPRRGGEALPNSPRPTMVRLTASIRPDTWDESSTARRGRSWPPGSWRPTRPSCHSTRPGSPAAPLRSAGPSSPGSSTWAASLP